MSTVAVSATLTHTTPSLANKQSWHSSNDLSARRSVLLHILMLLKSKYGKIDSKISLIGRRAELALYNQAFSVWEYHNPHTLGRRLYSLVLKLHLNNLTIIEDAAFTNEMTDSALSRKRKRSSKEDFSTRKHIQSRNSALITSPLFFDGNHDLQRHVCSFLDARDVLQWAATCSVAAMQLPALVTTINVTTVAMMKISPSIRSSFFRRFSNLEKFLLSGQVQAQQLNYQDEEILVARNVLVRSLLHALATSQLPKLTEFSLSYCYSEGLESHVTRQVASVLLGPSSNFPRLQTLSLKGNCISDDGVLDLYNVIEFSRPGKSCLALLDLSDNFLGERGHILMQELVTRFERRESSLVVNVLNNLLASACNVDEVSERRTR
ncbi:putative leucine-rich repeat domain superfamily [Plasmopara halstedii]